jgi:hypothetical protein
MRWHCCCAIAEIRYATIRYFALSIRSERCCQRFWLLARNYQHHVQPRAVVASDLEYVCEQITRLTLAAHALYSNPWRCTCRILPSTHARMQPLTHALTPRSCSSITRTSQCGAHSWLQASNRSSCSSRSSTTALVVQARSAKVKLNHLLAKRALCSSCATSRKKSKRNETPTSRCCVPARTCQR